MTEIPTLIRSSHSCCMFGLMRLGLETVAIIRSDWMAHSDLLGASVRCKAGDVQWLTAGAGLMHAQMCLLLNTHSRNLLDCCFKYG